MDGSPRFGIKRLKTERDREPRAIAHPVIEFFNGVGFCRRSSDWIRRAIDIPLQVAIQWRLLSEYLGALNPPPRCGEFADRSHR